MNSEEGCRDRKPFVRARLADPRNNPRHTTSLDLRASRTSLRQAKKWQLSEMLMVACVDGFFQKCSQDPYVSLESAHLFAELPC